jgi:hypothetical protein
MRFFYLLFVSLFIFLSEFLHADNFNLVKPHDLPALLSKIEHNRIQNALGTIKISLAKEGSSNILFTFEAGKLDYETIIDPISNKYYDESKRFKPISNDFFDIWLYNDAEKNIYLNQIDASFHIYYDADSELFELRFRKDHMDLTTRVTLYPLHLLPPHKELDSKNDNELYGDGLPSVSEFYSGKRADFQGRQLKDLHAFKGNYQRLYEVGDYIQWLFPAFTPAPHRLLAPLMTHDTVKDFAKNKELRTNLNKSFEMMLDFLGVEYFKEHQKIIKTKKFDERFKHWTQEIEPKYYNHSTLITCMLRSLKQIFWFEKKAHALYDFLINLEDYYQHVIGQPAFTEWSTAIGAEPYKIKKILSYKKLEKILKNTEGCVVQNTHKTIKISSHSKGILIEFKVGDAWYKSIVNEYYSNRLMEDSFKLKLETNSIPKQHINTNFKILYSKQKGSLELLFFDPDMILKTRVELYSSSSLPEPNSIEEEYYDGLPSVIDFYSNKYPGYNGRYLNDILSMKYNYHFLEKRHDFIQWLFPTFNRGMALAPLLSGKIIDQFGSNLDLQSNLRESFILFLDFLGLSFIENKVIKNISNDRLKEWITHGNHNFLRITRVLSALKNLGLKDEAKAFYEFLINELTAEQKAIVGQSSFNCWSGAVGQAGSSIRSQKHFKQEYRSNDRQEVKREDAPRDDVNDLSDYDLEFKFRDGKWIVIRTAGEEDELQTQFAYLMQTISLLNQNKLSAQARALCEYLHNSPNLDEESKKQLEEELIEFRDS